MPPGLALTQLVMGKPSWSVIGFCFLREGCVMSDEWQELTPLPHLFSHLSWLKLCLP